jgi:hypothetical protein
VRSNNESRTSLPETFTNVNIQRRQRPHHSQPSRASGWLPIEQEAKLAQRFFGIAADSSVPWQTLPNSIRIVSYRNGFVVLDADGQELFRKVTDADRYSSTNSKEQPNDI